MNSAQASQDFAFDLVTLGQFEAGGGREAQIRQYVRKKYRQALAGLAGLDPKALAGLFRGELVAGRPYATIQWVLRVTPFRPLDMFPALRPGPRVRHGPEDFFCPEEPGGPRRGRLRLCLGLRGPPGPVWPGLV